MNELELAAGGTAFYDMGEFLGHTLRDAWDGIRSGYEYVEIRVLDWVSS